MTIIITSGSIYAGQNISSGNPLVVESGGGWVYSTILSGGSATVSTGALGSDLIVDQGGLLQGGGTLVGITDVMGSISGLTIGSAGFVTVFAGGAARGLTVSGSPNLQDLVQVASGGSIADTNVVDGTEVLYAGATASGDIIQDGAYLFDDGASVSAETILSGGLLALGGVITQNLTVLAGPVAAAETISGVTVLSGGGVELLAATLQSGVTVSMGSAAYGIGLTVLKGATVVGSALLEDVTDIAGTVRQGVFSDGTATLSSGATASGAGVSAGGTMQIEFGATASGTLAGSGGIMIDLGSALATQINSGALAVVRSGGRASGTFIESGGKEILSSGGVSFGAVIESGGVEEDLAGGKTSGASISSGGRLIVSSGGLAEQIILVSGAVLTDLGAVRISGGVELGGSISGGGQIVEVGAGDLDLDGSDAGFSGAAVISGGTIELAGSHALGTGFAQFVEPSTGSAVLLIDSQNEPKTGTTYANTLSNFSGAEDELDLESVVYRSDAVATLEGSTLVLTEGTRTYTFNVAGSTAGSYSVTSDSRGGTVIVAGALPQFVQAAAAFAPAEAARMALVSSGAPLAPSPFLHFTASAGAGHA